MRSGMKRLRVPPYAHAMRCLVLSERISLRAFGTEPAYGATRGLQRAQAPVSLVLAPRSSIARLVLTCPWHHIPGTSSIITSMVPTRSQDHSP
eukprot:3941125-Rhodomonas_salina.3